MSPAGDRIRLPAEVAPAYLSGFRLLAKHDRGAASVLTTLAGRPLNPPSVVVVGEVKRGKSSLVNGLLGHDGLSPVGVEVTTAAFLRVVAPSERLPVGRAEIVLSDGSVREVSAQAAARAVDDRTADAFLRAERLEAIVVGAVVAAAGRHLPGVPIVDTPGIGGLVAAHAQVSRLAAGDAGVLLFVCDAGQILTAPELAFLTDVAAGADAVVLALTKTDRFPRWRETLDEDRRLLDRHAPRLSDVPIVPVSAALAAAAERLPAEQRDALEAAGNLPALAETLLRALDQRRQQRTRALMSDLDLALGKVAERVGERLVVLSDPAAAAGANDADREKLRALTVTRERAQADLERDLGRVRRVLANEIDTAITELQARWEADLARENNGHQEQVARRYVARLDSELIALAEEQGQRIRSAIAAVAGLRLDEEQADVVMTFVPALRVRAALPPAPSPSGPLTQKNATLVQQISGLARSLTIGIANPLMIPLVLGLGGGALWMSVRTISAQEGRRTLTTMVSQTLHRARNDLTAAVDDAIRETRPEIIVAYRRHLETVTRQTQERIADRDRLAKTSRDGRQSELAAVEHHLAAIADGRRQIAAVLSAPIAASPGTSPPRPASNP
ncbi:dynamin family protein [Actinoplanes sp. NPDC051470]|uniref:dynamin family protein n=1 Tax=Actinoplanes sp. NPDC051470 TaxID=3157224 RepID=UPI00342F83D9